MNHQNLLLQDDAFAPAAADTLEHLPSHHCVAQPDIDPRFAAAHYGHDLTPVPDCGACQGDGSICKTSCKVAEESPPVARDIKDLLMDYRQFDNDGVTVVVSREVMHSAADRIATLESEAEQLRMSVHNARIEIADLRAQLAAQAGQEPIAWLATDLDGRGDVGFNKEIAKSRAGEGCTEFIAIYDTPPAPANSIAIVQAALEAAAQVCIERIGTSETGIDGQDEDREALECANAIRAIDKQSILDWMSK